MSMESKKIEALRWNCPLCGCALDGASPAPVSHKAWYCPACGVLYPVGYNFRSQQVGKPGTSLVSSENRPVTLAAFGVEGGGCSLLGRKDAVGTIEYCCVETSGGFDEWPSAESATEWTRDWQEALRRLDKQPWWRFQPLEIHPTVVEAIWVAYLERLVGSAVLADHEIVDGARFEQWCQTFGKEPWFHIKPLGQQ
jgi:hypothetical protein